MESAGKVPLHTLTSATVAVIECLLAEMPKQPPSGYRTDHSKQITGYDGVSAHIYTGPGEANLQVTGPEPLIQKIVQLYGPQYRAWGREDGNVIFTIQ